MGASLPWLDAAPLPACEGREHVKVLEMLRRYRTTSLTHPTMLEQSHVWGQHHCCSIIEMAPNMVISVQGGMNGDIQVELCLYLSHVLFTVPWSPG